MGGARRSGARLAVKGVLALVVTALALGWAAKGVDFEVVGRELERTSWGAVALFAVSSLFVHASRVMRWGLLVLPLGRPSRRAVFSAASVGIPASMFLPLRLGELVRPVMLARSGVPFAGGLASVVVERVADGVTNVGLFFALLAALPESAPIPDEIRLGSRIALGVFGGACLVLVLTAYLRGPAIAFLRRILEPISKTFAIKVAGLLETFIIGLRPLFHPGRLLAFVALTALYWGINGLATWYLIASFGLDVPVIAGPFVITVVVFAVMIPAGPAFIGPMQAGFRAGLAPFGVSVTNALVVGIVVHATTIATMALVMAVGFLAAEPGQAANATSVPPEA